jgi:glutamate racemase
VATQNSPIGVFDSGIGGLTVVRALKKALPTESLIYLGDTARLPYGSKSAATVTRYSSQIADFLVGRQVKYLVVACNTASAYALPHLRQSLQIPLMGVVEPGAALAVASSPKKKIGVLGTRGTINSQAYREAILRLNPEVDVFSQACPLLVPLAEEGWLDTAISADIVQHYLDLLKASCGEIDALVLGCTHYPVLKDLISLRATMTFGHQIHVIDSADAVADAVAKDLELQSLEYPPGLTAGADHFLFTDDSRFNEIGKLFLGRNLSNAEHVDL